MSTRNERGDDGGFCVVLIEVLAGHKLIDALLEHPIFNGRLITICRGLAKDWADADDLANDIRHKLCTKLHCFTPDYSKPYANFFSWLSTVTRNQFFDRLPANPVAFVDKRPEELYDVASNIDIEKEIVQRELAEEFSKCAASFSKRHQFAMERYFEGFSFREVGKMMGISHVTARRLVLDILEAFFDVDTAEEEAC